MGTPKRDRRRGLPTARSHGVSEGGAQSADPAPAAPVEIRHTILYESRAEGRPFPLADLVVTSTAARLEVYRETRDGRDLVLAVDLLSDRSGGGGMALLIGEDGGATLGPLAGLLLFDVRNNALVVTAEPYGGPRACQRSAAGVLTHLPMGWPEPGDEPREPGAYLASSDGALVLRA